MWSVNKRTWAVWIDDCFSRRRLDLMKRPLLASPSGMTQRGSRAQELQTQAKYLSLRKANWWLRISLLPCEPVNQRAAITHVLTACNGILFGWAKGCQAARCRSEKQLGGLEIQQEATRRENKKKTHQQTHTHCLQPSYISVNYRPALRTQAAIDNF